MRSSNEIIIHAPLERIFALAAEVETWGRILPHYRYVRLLQQRGNRKWVRMSAWRNFIPVTWTAIETLEEGKQEQPGAIRFKHIRGLVRGMDVEWSFHPQPDGSYLVRIAHDLPNPPMPVRLLGPKLIDLVVSKGFIEHIAGKTLKRIKQIAEADRE